MKSRNKKTDELKAIKNRLPQSKMVIFTTFSRAGEKGLSVAQMTALKRLLRSLGSEYFVTKKTLIDLAARDKNYDGLDVYSMEGSVGLVLGPPVGEAGSGDPYGIAKSVYDFSKKNPALHFWGAIMDGKFIDVNAFLEVAKMPSREVLIGRLLGMLTYPVRGLAVALNEISKRKN